VTKHAGGRCHSTQQAEFSKDRGEMIPHGHVADVQRPCNSGVSPTQAHERHDVPLCLRQPCPSGHTVDSPGCPTPRRQLIQHTTLHEAPIRLVLLAVKPRACRLYRPQCSSSWYGPPRRHPGDCLFHPEWRLLSAKRKASDVKDPSRRDYWKESRPTHGLSIDRGMVRIVLTL
jgi:hypothetical protein